MTEIVRTDGVLGGEPRLAGHRISVVQIADMVIKGERSPEYVADQLDLTLADVHSALAYYYGNPEEMDAVRRRHRELEEKLEAASSAPEPAEQ